MHDLLPDVCAASSEKIGERIRQLATSLYAGDYATSVKLLLEQNQEVMSRRGGGPWMHLNDDAQLEVRYRYEDTALPDRDRVPDIRIHAYFLDSLKILGRALYFNTPEELVDDAA
jgi:hypothetical protein